MILAPFPLFYCLLSSFQELFLLSIRLAVPRWLLACRSRHHLGSHCQCPHDSDGHCRVDWGPPVYRQMFVFSVCHLVSRWCHNIFAIHQSYLSPSQNRTSGFPTSGSSFKHSDFSYSCQVCAHSLFLHCIRAVFLHSRAFERGNFHSTRISRFFAKPVPVPLSRSRLNIFFYVVHSYP